MIADRTALLEIEGLTYTYPAGGGPALRDVSLTVGTGEFVVLAGRSASGKSTLLRACCGLVPGFYGGEMAGTVTVAGRDASAAGPSEMAEVAGYLAQEPEAQIVSTTVAAEISLPLEMRGESATTQARAVEEVALALAIPHLLDRVASELSGGEQQRVALAAALVTRPRLVLLDEPTSQLDPVAGDELIWLLRRLNSEWGVTVILAEHRLERCLAAADRVLGFTNGTLGFDGEPAAFLEWAGEAEPALTTPASRLFRRAGISPPPAGVREARMALTRAGIEVAGAGAAIEVAGEDPGAIEHLPAGGGAALRLRDVWVELSDGDDAREALRGVGLTAAPGERIALMGRNGAGKSTLLRAAAGLLKPVRGRIELAGDMALLTQNPADYLVRERVGDELPGNGGSRALAEVGLAGTEDSDPRDLSGGQRQRLALAITMAGRREPGQRPAVVALDEPTRGLDSALKNELAGLARDLADGGAAVIIATHDVEFAAAFAERVVLLGPGNVIADGPAKEVLSGGWYFATEVARILGLAGVITPERGAAVLTETMVKR